MAAEADALGPCAEGERERLQLGAAGKHELQVVVTHARVGHAQHLEVGENVRTTARAGGIGERPIPEEEALERSTAEDVGGEAQFRARERGRNVVDEDQVLHALAGEEARPLHEVPLMGRE